jgi:hypothetical protein
VLVRRGKGGRRRQVGMDDWAWEQLEPWLKGPCRSTGRAAVLRDQRTDPRTRVVNRGSTRPAPRDCCALRRPPTLRATPTPARTRRRDGS